MTRINSNAFSLVELAVSMLIVSVLMMGLLMVMKQSLMEKQTTRLKLHQQITLNNFRNLFEIESRDAGSSSVDAINGRWIAFENDTYVVRYLYTPPAGANPGNFTREIHEKGGPMPRLLNNPNAMPGGWLGQVDERTSALDQLPPNYQMQLSFTCGTPCFMVSTDGTVQWNEPAAVSITPAGYETRVSDVFGEMSYQVPDVVVTQSTGLVIP